MPYSICMYSMSLRYELEQADITLTATTASGMDRSIHLSHKQPFLMLATDSKVTIWVNQSMVNNSTLP